MDAGESRRAELVASLGAVRARIAAACQDAGRSSGEVTLVAVTKTYPATDVATLVELGVRDIGENRDQEARAKVAETARVLTERGTDPARVRWHFVGQLQSRKCRSVARYASAVHSLDRLELVDLLSDGLRRAERGPLEVFVQVSLDDDPHRGGAPPGELAALAAAVVAQPQLRLRGVMAVAPLGTAPAAAFARLAELSDGLRRTHPAADAISAGMSGDLEASIAAGATHVRVGSALLGRRRPNVR